MKTRCKIFVVIILLLPALAQAEMETNNATAINEVKSDQDLCGQEVQFAEVKEGEPPAITEKPGSGDDKDDKNAADDWKKNGLFHALFHVGVNMAQIDGDAYAGYNKIGFDAGGGVLVRFHKYLSASVELNYTQWGAKYSIISNANDSLGQRYRTNLNYIQVPISINVHDKEIIMFSAGVNLSFLIKYNERNEIGVNVTDSIHPQPKIFDLDAFAALTFIIKKQFGIGVKFSYSMLPFRGVEPQYKALTHIQGEYNNVLTFRFTYILSAFKKKQ